MLAVPDREYKERIRTFQTNIRAAGLDAALVHSNEADFANVRYLSDYWPTFEAGGVFVPAKGRKTTRQVLYFVKGDPATVLGRFRSDFGL